MKNHLIELLQSSLGVLCSANNQTYIFENTKLPDELKDIEEATKKNYNADSYEATVMDARMNHVEKTEVYFVADIEDKDLERLTNLSGELITKAGTYLYVASTMLRWNKEKIELNKYFFETTNGIEVTFTKHG